VQSAYKQQPSFRDAGLRLSGPTALASARLPPRHVSWRNTEVRSTA
jgi:hypothetical protein